MTNTIANMQPSSDLMAVAHPPHIGSARYGYEISRVAFPTQEEWTRLSAYAELAVTAKINKTIENKGQAMVVALKGWHLGIDPMEAFQQIVIIDNKTTIQVQLMIAQANSSNLIFLILQRLLRRRKPP